MTTERTASDYLHEEPKALTYKWKIILKRILTKLYGNMLSGGRAVVNAGQITVFFDR
jgi:hypothetical protein